MCPQLVVRAFIEADSDEAPMLIFSRNEIIWRSIRAEVKEFVLEGCIILEWEQEHPSWYNDRLPNKLPEDMLTGRVLKDLEKRNKEKRARDRSKATTKHLRGGLITAAMTSVFEDDDEDGDEGDEGK